jgi:hypothetical protein
LPSMLTKMSSLIPKVMVNLMELSPMFRWNNYKDPPQTTG